MLVLIARKGVLQVPLNMASPWIENNRPVAADDGTVVRLSHEAAIARIEALPNPRVFKQHVVWSEIARSADAEIQAQVHYVTITRDIRDVPWSLYQHAVGLSDEFKLAQFGSAAAHLFFKTQDFDSFFDDWLDGCV
jgi:hypothetical protein